MTTPENLPTVSMPLYKSHKIVGALKIKTITAQTNGMYLLESEEGYAPFEVSEAYVSKHQPQLGDYFVQYKDGYRSCSPAGVFEEGNLPIGSNAVDFGTVLMMLKQGARAHRASWLSAWISMSGANQPRQIPAEAFWSINNRAYALRQPNESAIVLPCLTMKMRTGEIMMGWLPDIEELLAEDWEILL